MRNKIRHKKAILYGSMLKGFGKGTARQSWRIPVSNLETLSGLQNHFMDKKTKAMKTEATNEPTKTKVEDTEDVY